MKLLSKCLLFAITISSSEILSNDIEVKQESNKQVVSINDLDSVNDIYSNIVEDISISFMNLCNIENNAENLLKFNEYFSNLLSMYENQFNSIHKSVEEKGLAIFEDKLEQEINEMISNLEIKYSENKEFSELKKEFINSFISSSIAAIDRILALDDEKLNELLENISEGSLDKLIVQSIKNLNNDENSTRDFNSLNNLKDDFKNKAFVYYEAVSRIFDNYDYLLEKVISVDNLLLDLAKEKINNLNK